MSLSVFLSLAYAQTFDGSGPIVPPLRAAVTDPIFGLGGAPADGGGLSVLAEAASNTLVRELQDGEELIVDPIVGTLFGLDLAGYAPLGRRVDVALSGPVWLATDGIATGPAVGDFHLWVPIRAVDRGPFDVAVVPFLRVPTGPDARYLGDPAGAGLLASVGTDAGPLFAHADLGFDAGGATGSDDWAGSVRARFALDGGVQVGEVALHAELRGRSPLGSSVVSVPTEAILGIRGKAAERVSLSLGAGRAITSGVGAGGLRMFVGSSFQLGKQDAAPRISEGPRKEVREVNIIDSRRLPVRGATVVAGATEVLSDHEGFADLPIKAVKSGELTVSAPGYLPVTRSISVDEPYWEIQLERAPVAVSVSVVAPDGSIVDAAVTIVGPSEVGVGILDTAGVEHWDLAQGDWNVRIEAEGYGGQERSLVIDERRIDPIRVDAILTPEVTPGTELAVRVVDALGRPVEDAVVAVENRDLGTTGSGGDLSVEGLEEGEHAIVVRSTQFGQAVVSEVTLTPDGEEEVVVTLDWQPGSVLVQVEGPDGQPTDAIVRMSGPEALPERALGSDGEELFMLGPGTWELEVESATLAPQRRVIVVDDIPGKLITLQLGMLPEENGEADLDLLVVDPDGWPVEGLEVSLDGSRAGRTGPDGTLSLQELQTGIRFIQLQGALTVPRLTEVELLAQRQRSDVIVWWVDGVVDLEVVSGETGSPLDATVSPHGPSEFPAFGLGLDGFERRVFEPGPWAFEVAAEGLEPRSRFVEVAAGTHRRQRLQFRLEPPAAQVGRLTLLLRDPTGGAPAMATVRLGGEDAGEAVNGFFQLDGVPMGPLEIEVDAVGFAVLSQSIEVEEQTEVVLEPGWAPGAVKVTASGPDGPLDAVLAVRGAERRTPIELTRGSGLLELAPGTWTLSASFPGLATAEETVELGPEGVLTEVVLILTEERPVVLLEVTSPDAAPVANAEVRVAGEVVGRTDAQGKVSFDTQPQVATTVEIVPEGDTLEAIEVALPASAGEQEHDLVVPYAARDVEVAVVSLDGVEVESATLEAFGDGKVEGAAKDGSGTLALAPGTWTVTGRTAEGEVGTARVVVPAKGETTAVEVVLDAVEASAEGDVLRPVSPILFDLDSDVLREDAMAIIHDMARWLKADRTVALAEVAGHTDDQGGVVYNQQLSERRAEAVRRALVARGVPQERLVARGYGLSRPASQALDDASRQRNRRVELKVLRQAGE